MIFNLTAIRAVVIFDWFLNHFPNFDGEMPADAFYNAFFLVSHCSMSSFIRFTSELILLGVIYREGTVFVLRKDKYGWLKSTLLDVEKQRLPELEKKLLDGLAKVDEKTKKEAKKQVGGEQKK